MNRKKFLSLAIVIVAVMGLSIMPTTVFAEDGGVQYPIPQDAEPHGDNWNIVIEEFYIIEMTNIFERGDTAHIFYKVKNTGTDPSPPIELVWTATFFPDEGDDEEIIIGHFPLDTGNDYPSGGGGGGLDPGEWIADIYPYYCTALGLWYVELTVLIDDDPGPSAGVWIVVVPKG